MHFMICMETTNNDNLIEPIKKLITDPTAMKVHIVFDLKDRLLWFGPIPWRPGILSLLNSLFDVLIVMTHY